MKAEGHACCRRSTGEIQADLPNQSPPAERQRFARIRRELGVKGIRSQRCRWVLLLVGGSLKPNRRLCLKAHVMAEPCK